MADLRIIDADPSQPPSHAAVINLANRLLAEFNIPTRIQDVSDISASLFVVLYESLFSDKLPGIIRQPVAKEDEIHNCQIVIDVLSTDVVRDSLSHIRGTEIVAGDVTAISNLLDIFSYLIEYVVNRIESDPDDTRSIGTVDHDLDITSESQRKETVSAGKKIPEIPMSMKHSLALSNRTNNNGQKVKGKSVIGSDGQTGVNLNKNENRKAFEDHKIISHEDFYAMSHGGLPRKEDLRPPSPIKHDQSQSLLGQQTIDSEFDVDFEKGKQAASPAFGKPKIAWDDGPSRRTPDILSRDGVTLKTNENAASAAAIGVSVSTTSKPAISNTNGTVHYTFTHHLYHHYDKRLSQHRLSDTKSAKPYSWETTRDHARPVPSFSASMPPPSRQSDFEKPDPFRSTVGPIPYHTHLTPEKPLVERTPPVKGLSSSYNDLRQLVERTAALTRVALETSPVRTRMERDLDITDVTRERPRPKLSSDNARLAKELNALGLSPGSGRNVSPGRIGKKVAFAQSDLRYSDRFDSDYSRRPLSALSSNEFKERSSRTRGRGAYNSDSDDLYETGDVQRRLDYGTGARKKKTTKTKGKTKEDFALHLARNRQPELGAAHMTLKTEDRAIRKKQDILRKFYEKDHEEFVDDVEYMLGRDAEKSKETEERYLKECAATALKKKPQKKAKGSLVHLSSKKPRISKGVSTKARRKRPEGKGLAASPTLKLESEEDLLPLLLEEFPHLHLSEHTWHELWRRGLHQIEALTRTHQESQRKKSRAQSQLEDAAERHDLLSNIMKKQLDHAKRLREVKEQKQIQVQLRNKTHEKRIQSARARRYYNEYQVRSRSKQLKRRTKEEMVFRELFKEALCIQKERIKDIRQYATDQRQKQESRRQNEIDSLENFYQGQFELLAERLTKERYETELRASAQQQMMDRMKRELRKKMESEIKQYQEQMFRDDDDAHFRQMDAEKIKQQLHMARYSSKI